MVNWSCRIQFHFTTTTLQCIFKRLLVRLSSVSRLLAPLCSALRGSRGLPHSASHHQRVLFAGQTWQLRTGLLAPRASSYAFSILGILPSHSIPYLICIKAWRQYAKHLEGFCAFQLVQSETKKERKMRENQSKFGCLLVE